MPQNDGKPDGTASMSPSAADGRIRCGRLNWGPECRPTAMLFRIIHRRDCRLSGRAERSPVPSSPASELTMLRGRSDILATARKLRRGVIAPDCWLSSATHRLGRRPARGGSAGRAGVGEGSRSRSRRAPLQVAGVRVPLPPTSNDPCRVESLSRNESSGLRVSSIVGL